jgi:DNA-binding response OmpR family regulator
MSSAGLILLADDDVAFRKATVMLLKNYGYECDCAGSGDEAASLLQAKSYDLLISDIEMPGNQDLQLIRALPKLREGLPVILMTGYPSVQSAAQSVGLAVASYLIKPVTPGLLLESVAAAVERSRCHRIVADARQRFLATCTDMEQLESALRYPSDAASAGSIKLFLDLTMKNVAYSLQDLRSLIDILASSARPAEDLRVLQNSRPLVLLDALRDTILVLEKTKSSFRSKELGELRKRLEILIRPPSQALVDED